MNKALIVAVVIILAILLFWEISTKKTSSQTPTASSSQPATSSSNWLEFHSPSGDFKALLPSTPQHLKNALAIPYTDKKRRYEIYATERQGQLFMINVITYPPDFNTSNANDILQGILDELLLSHPDNHLVDQKEAVYQNSPSIDFAISNTQFKVEGKAFMIGKSAYVLTYTAPKNDFNAQDYENFVSSFTLLKNFNSSTP